MSQKPFSSDGGFITPGNVVANVFIGDGSLLTGVTADTGNIRFVGNAIYDSNGLIIENANVGTPATAALLLPANNDNSTVQLNNFAGNVTIATGGLGSNQWTFDSAGNLTLPTGTPSINYANGTSILSGIGGNYGNANVAAYLPNYNGNIGAGNVNAANAINAVGDITTFANIVASPGGFFIGNGSLLTGLPASYSDANVTTLLASGNVSTNIVTTANITAQTDLYAFNNVTSYGNVTATANITALPGGFFIGDGGLLSNISTGANTANIVFSSSNISTNQASDILITGANGNAVTIISNTFAELQWTDNLATANGYNGNSQYVWVDVDGAHVITDDLAGNTYQWDFTTSGSTGFPGPINATTGLNFLGNTQVNGELTIGGAGLGLSQNRVPFIGAGNGLVIGSAGLTFNNTTSTFSTVNANITGSLTANGVVQFNGNNVYLTNYANIQGAGNVYANAFIGDGSQLTGLAPAYANANAIAMMNAGIFTGDFIPNSNSIQSLGSSTNRWKSVYLAGNTIYLGDAALSSVGGTLEINGATVITEQAGGNIDVPNYVNANGLVINGSTIITGNANVQGTLTYNNLTTLTTSNLVLGLGNTQTGINVTGAGIVAGNTNEAEWLYNQPQQSWVSNINITSNANVSASYFLGDGSQLTNLPVQPGTYSNTNVAAYLSSNGAVTITTTANITGSNIAASNVTVTGNITAANLGNIAAVNLTGNASQVLYGNGVFAAVAGGTGNYGDSNVVNLLSAFGSNGISTTGAITAGSVSVYGPINSVGNTANAFTTATTVNLGANTTTVNIGNASGTVNLIGNVQGSTNGFAIGYRDIPQVPWTSNTTISLSDAGKHYYANSGSNLTLTIANSATSNFAVGAAINIINQGIGTMTIAQGSGVTLYLAGNATASNRTISSYGMATIQKVATNTWFIVGVGVN